MLCVKLVHSGVNRASRRNVARQDFEAEAERNATSKRDWKTGRVRCRLCRRCVV